MAAPVFVFQGELLHQAAIFDQRDLLKSLLQAGVHGEANSPDPRGLTPLHTAALHDSVHCLKELLDWKGTQVYSMQARIHTGFHRFTEIGQILQNYSETSKRGLQELNPSRRHSLFRKPVTIYPGSVPAM